MRNRVATSLAATAVVGLAMSSSPSALAQQVDTNPPLPNVLLMVDNSGSMERMIDGSLPESTPANTCNCVEVPGSPPTANCTWATQPLPNRWGVLTQALTGTFQNGYNCLAMPRKAGSTFTNIYQIGGVNPYDASYQLNYHRPIAEDTSTGTPTACVYAPGLLPGALAGSGVGPSGAGSGGRGAGNGQSALDFPPDAIITRPYGATAVTAPNSCVFAQYADGAVPTFKDLIRFGLMTFDSDKSQATGVTSGSPPTVVGAGFTDPISPASGAFTGMWSYFPNWSTGGTCTYGGSPANCGTSTLMAVGARNPAAPPWEGRMMMFPTKNDLTTQEQANAQVANIINAARPYGATPLAGMFQDAQTMFWTDPGGPQQTDAFSQAGCRKQFILLLTDGAPNMDMRPDCAASGSPNGTCPFPLPETIAATLYAGGASQPSVTTFVIGFAVSSVQDGATTIECSSLVTSGTLSGVCSDPTKQALYGPCCELQRIALAGSGAGVAGVTPTPAFFADTPGDLQKALNAVLGVVSTSATTRTVPAFAPAGTNTGSANGSSSIYLASFNPSPGLSWTGDVIRQRYECSGTFTVTAPVIDPTKGDDFAANLNSASATQRNFIALEPGTVVEGGKTVHDPTLTIRPYITSSPADGLPVYSATTYAGPASTLITNLTPDALGITASTCQYTSTGSTHALKSLSTSDCENMVVDYTTALPSFTGTASDFSFVSRAGRALGDIYHATPAVVGPPASLLQDPSYEDFQHSLTAAPARVDYVYAATNDGLLHAFLADPTSLTNNEEWALLPPAVMPNLASSYPSSHEFLLDGSPVVQDVVWDRSASTPPTPWHTMLVAGFGTANSIPGYYAVDVTQPDPGQLQGSKINGTVPSDEPPVGPEFRWQLTTVPTSNYPIFAAHSATPAIATIFMDPDGAGPREIGVAILPGGQDGPPTTSAASGSSCPRYNGSAFGGSYPDSAPVNGAFPARTGVRCWGPNKVTVDQVNGRAITIVRIDTGEILRVFTRKKELTTEFPNDTILAKGRVTDVPFDSPMTGTPIVYPYNVGTDATKIFASDADGTIWRLDLSNPDPSKWSGGLYLDAYNTQVDTNAAAWADGEPFQVTPTLALDSTGELVLNAATTVTDSYDTNGIYFVYSITEKVQGATPGLHAWVNWYLGSPLTKSATAPMALGERVSGPMTVFNSTLYFATYAAAAPPAPPASSCNGGTARVWGVDFVQPADPTCTFPTPSAGCDFSKGGKPELLIPPATVFASSYTPSADPTSQVQPGAVIPGVAIKQTPACSSSGSSANPYGPGGLSSMQNFTPAQFSLFSQVGEKGAGTSPGAGQMDLHLNPPQVASTIDSWAAVLE